MRWIVLMIFGTFALSYGQEATIDRFYSTADSVASYPPAGEKLTILCQKKIDQYYVSFLGTASAKKAMIVVVTPKTFTEPDSVYLTVGFNGYRPTTGKYPTWGYIFDRNGDGKIDYLALMSGAAAFKDKSFPQQYPRRKEYFTKSQLEYFIAHCKLIFNHWSDDNYDGNVDALVHVDLDSTRDWVERRIMARSKMFGKSFDDVWGFHESVSETHEQLPFTTDRIPFHSLMNTRDAITWKMLDTKSSVLQLLNRAVKACGLTAAKFAHPGPQD